MEVMKQMYDVGTLLDEFTDFNLVYDTYFKVATEEIFFHAVSTNAHLFLTLFKWKYC